MTVKRMGAVGNESQNSLCKLQSLILLYNFCLYTRLVGLGWIFTNLVPWATNNGREDSPWGVITGETGLAHAGAIVNDQSGDLIVTHDGAVCAGCCWRAKSERTDLLPPASNLYIGTGGP